MVAAIIVGILSIGGIWFYFAFVNEAPSCKDFVQNQDEEGVDCGGVCSRLCAPALADPQVSFVRAVASGPGRTDVIAYIENPNQTARAEAEYSIELFDAGNVIVARKEGTIDLPPNRTPLFVPNFFSGDASGLRAFLSINDETLDWFEDVTPEVTLTTRDIRIEHTDTLPRIYATLENPSHEDFKNIRVVITVFDEDNNAIAASQTVVQELKGQGTVEVVFTWNAPFSGTPARQEIIPIFSGS